jgi:hypothetical protein
MTNGSHEHKIAAVNEQWTSGSWEASNCGFAQSKRGRAGSDGRERAGETGEDKGRRTGEGKEEREKDGDCRRRRDGLRVLGGGGCGGLWWFS